MNIELLKRLCETPGIAGREDQVRGVVIEAIRPLVDDLRVDVMGNLFATKRGNGGPRVMIAAHMDEIGFFVKHVDDHGFIRLQPVGGFDARVLLAQRVLVHGFAGKVLRGAVQMSAKPIHLLDPNEAKSPKLEELFVDVGLGVDEVRAAVEIGDMVTLDRTLELVGDTIVSKSLDDRVGVYVMIEAMRAAGKVKAEVVGVATVQEEIGLRGAETAAYQVEPDIAIALDVTLANDYPGGPPDQAITRLGQGMGIKIMDSSLLTHPALLRHIRKLADKHKIPYQLEILPRGGTDAGAAQRVRGGVAAMTLSIPARYVHTVNEMAHLDDIDACVDLLARFLSAAGDEDYSFPRP
ncbi:MAG: M42 family metallopeptidase [Chloroflexota bacterium]|nr:M42 family metallopeptidase [Chloroflexota bacterium]